MAEAEKTIHINSCGSNVYTFFAYIFQRCWFLLRKAICAFDKGGNKVILIFQLGRGRIWCVSSSLRVNFVGITKGGWCWIIWFAVFFFRAEFKPHFQWHVWYPVTRNFFQLRQQPLPWKHSIWGATTGRGLHLDIGRNTFPEAIKTFTQHLCGFQKIFSWGGNKDDESGDFLFPVDYIK